MPERLVDLRVVSAGVNGVLDIDHAAASEEVNEKTIGDDVHVVLALRPGS